MKTAAAAKIHPAARLAALVAALVALTAFNDPAYVATLAAIVVAVALAACGAGRVLWRSFPLLATFVVLSVILWPPFVAAGEPAFRVGFYRATDAGLRYGLAVGLRIVAMFAAGAAFLTVTKPEEFATALRTFRFPAAATVTFALAFRLLPVMFETTARALEAQRARGMAFGRNFFSQARRVTPLVIPVFLYSLRSTDQMAVALELRGYRAGRLPTRYGEKKATAVDWLTAAAAWAGALAAVGARLAGWGAVLAGRL